VIPMARSMNLSIGAKSDMSYNCIPQCADYYLGFFLVGAYQENLGDLHNLFGIRTPCTSPLPQTASTTSKRWCPGDTVTDVLEYVSYSREDLLARLRRSVECALRPAD